MTDPRLNQFTTPELEQEIAMTQSELKCKNCQKRIFLEEKELSYRAFHQVCSPECCWKLEDQQKK